MEFSTMFSFTGRAGRLEYWLIYLITLVSMLPLCVIGYLAYVTGSEFFLFLLALCMFAWVIFSFWVSLATTVRRLHDHGKSGWWYLAYLLVPMLINMAGAPFGGTVAVVLSAISMLIYFATLTELGFIKGTSGPNAYGDDRTAMPSALPVPA